MIVVEDDLEARAESEVLVLHRLPSLSWRATGRIKPLFAFGRLQFR
jgi:hypothetical protein